MDIVLRLHSLVRWLVLLAAVAAVIKFAIGWLRGGAFGQADRGLSLGFSGLLDLQALLGLIVLIGGGLGGAGFPRYRLEHAVLMLAAVVVGHLPSRWKQAAAAIRFRNALLCVFGALLLVIAGIAVLSGGLSR
jgi:hypothetical protein